MELLSIEHGNSIVLSGELDLSTAPELEQALKAAVERGGPVLVDLSELTFMDSTGIHALVGSTLSLRGRGCLILHGEQENVGRLLDMAGIDGSTESIHRIPRSCLPAADGKIAQSQRA